MKLLPLILAAALLLSGCDERSANIKIDTNSSPVWLRYRVIQLEGRTFIATHNHFGEWVLTGPIDR